MRKLDWAAVRGLNWTAIGGIALRNAVPVAGMIVSGFRAGEIVLLYYVDTIASIATVFALIMMYVKGMGVDASKPLGALNIAFSTAFITAIFAFVCAMPLAIAAATDGIDWKSEPLRCTTIPWAPVLVLTYVIASIWLEVKPIPLDEPPSVPSSAEAMRSPPAARGGSRRRHRRDSP